MVTTIDNNLELKCSSPSKLENLNVAIKDHNLSDLGLEHTNDELAKDHDEQEELEKILGNFGKNAHGAKSSSPSKKGKKKKRPIVEKVHVATNTRQALTAKNNKQAKA